MDRERVVVTGLGAITSVGSSAESTWRSLREGRSGIQWITDFDVDPYSSKVASLVTDFEPADHMPTKTAKRMSRFSHFALVAGQEAIADACLDTDNEDPFQCGVLLGCSIGGIDEIEATVRKTEQSGARFVSAFFIPKVTPNMAAFAISREFGLRGYNYTISTGCASGTQAIGEAAEVIRRGQAKVMVTGGTEAAITETVFAGFSNMGALSTHNDPPASASRPFDRDRDGFVIAEGAAILVLESLSHARERGARIYGEVAGYGTTADAHHFMAPDPTGRAVLRAIQIAMGGASVRAEEIDYINTHGTGTPLGDAAETRAIKEALGEHAYRIPLNSTKSLIGHSLGASGAIEAVAIMKSMQDGWLHPTINLDEPDPECDLDYVPREARKYSFAVALSNSIGLGGQNATLLFRAVT